MCAPYFSTMRRTNFSVTAMVSFVVYGPQDSEGFTPPRTWLSRSIKLSDTADYIVNPTDVNWTMEVREMSQS